MFKTIEKVESTIFSWGNLKFNTTVINGSKDLKENRKDAFYYRTYDSQKYNNENTLDNLSINYNKFLVVSYKAYNENNEFESVEIYLSFQHIESLKNTIIEAYEQLSEYASKIYGDNKINPKFEELIWQLDHLSQDRSIGIYPDKIEDSNGVLQNGVVIVLLDNDLQVQQPMNFNVFEGLVNVIKDYDLLTDARLVSIEGLLSKLLLSGNSESITPTRTTLKGRNNGGFTKPNGIGRKTTTSIKDLIDDDENDETELDTSEKEIKPATKKVTKNNKNKKNDSKTTKKKPVEDNSTSLDDMLKAGEGYEFSLSDEDEEEELF